MNHITTDPALPESDPYAVIRQRIATVRRRLDKLFSLISVTQRVAYLGIYIWMLIIVREIELLRLPTVEMDLKNVSETPTLLEGTPNEF